MPAATIRRTCPRCKVRFTQPDDPGRKRVYCSAACKQAAYRARQRAQRQASQDRTWQHRQEDWTAGSQDWARQQRQEHSRQKRERTHAAGNGHRPSAGRFDSAEQARARRRIEALLRKAVATQVPDEADACRAKAEHLRDKHGL
jgi:transcription initiation factor TFIID subunit TAF12